jgi:hypothetical protein
MTPVQDVGTAPIAPLVQLDEGQSPHYPSGAIPMICFEVYRNGKKTRTAGVEKGLLNFSLTHVTGLRECPELLSFNISGIIERDNDDDRESITWTPLSQTAVKVGDKIAIRIVERSKCDKPIRLQPSRKRKRRTAAGRPFRLRKEVMPLSTVEESLLVAAYYRGMSPKEHGWVSNSDQIVTLSLFYTGEISSEDCTERFARRSYVGRLYQPDGELSEPIATRYGRLISLLRDHPELIGGGGDLETPSDPTFTSCRLTAAGRYLASSLVPSFPKKPKFPNWPDKRITPNKK